MKPRKVKPRVWDGRDHTAPWHCGREDCDRCEGKPSYGTWALEQERKRQNRKAIGLRRLL